MHSGSSSAPLLYVRFASPAAARVSLFQGPGQGREFTAPVTVGLRPGYIYRVKMANLPEHADAALFPTLEARGTLQLPSNLRASNYPAPIVLSQEDIERALAGTLVTKVIYLKGADGGDYWDPSFLVIIKHPGDDKDDECSCQGNSEIAFCEMHYRLSLL